MRDNASTATTKLRRLDASKLRPGDIILTSDHSGMSQAIQAATRSDISHAMIYVESQSIIDANREGVHARNTQRLHFPHDCALYVLRPRENLSPAQIEALCLFARGKVGSEYTTIEAVQSVSPVRLRAGRKQFCSRLVAQAYAFAGRPLGDEPDYLSPGDLLRNAGLEQLEDVTVEVEPEEAEAWSAHRDPTQLMRDTTNTVLTGVREFSPAIQTFDDLNDFLIAEPGHDAAVLSIYEASGYLDVWKVFARQNPWHYDLDLMTQVARQQPAQMEAYCLDTLRNLEGLDRYRHNLAGYTALQRAHGLRTFQRMRDLYAQLARLDALREEVARAWLEGHAAHHFVAATPHSDAWFRALALRNPGQATHSRKIIELAGRTDVCTVCGDDPAIDLRLIEEGVPPDQSFTMKLCDDCRAIRTGVGECFEPLAGPFAKSES